MLPTRSCKIFQQRKRKLAKKPEDLEKIKMIRSFMILLLIGEVILGKTVI